MRLHLGALLDTSMLKLYMSLMVGITVQIRMGTLANR